MAGRRTLSDEQQEALRNALPGVVASLASQGVVVNCFCGQRMGLRVSKWGYFWSCTAFRCDGTHGAHADGRPLGTPADKETKEARIRAHAAFDRLWREKLVPSRRDAYIELRKALKLSEHDGHISNMTKETALKVEQWAMFFVNTRMSP